MVEKTTMKNEEECESFHYRRTKMQKAYILQKLKQKGCRITRQRLMLLDIILEEECSCCKEIYYRAARQDPHIGTATVYRMVNILEEIGAISRKNMYRVECEDQGDGKDVCIIELDDNTIRYLSEKKWNSVILAGLKACGYVDRQRIRSVEFQSSPIVKES